VRVSLPHDRFPWEEDSQYLVSDVFNHLPVNGQPQATVRGRDLENLTMRLGSLESALLVINMLSGTRLRVGGTVRDL